MKNVGRLNIDGTNLDLSEGVFLPLNYSLADVQNPDKRKRNSSEVFTLPGTRKNLDFFFSAWNLGISDDRGDGIGFDFDPTIKLPATYYQNEKQIFIGSAQLQQVTIKEGVYTFHLILFSEVVDVFQTLGDLTLPELDWSAYDFTLNETNIKNTWTAATGSGIWIPLIDYGFTQNLQSYKTNELFPYVYKKEVWEKAFALVGQTIDSDFFDTAAFKNIVIGTGGGDKILLDPAEIAERQSNWTADGSISKSALPTNIQTITTGLSTAVQADYDFNETIIIGNNAVVTATIGTDPIPQFDAVAERLTISNTGSYRLSTYCTIIYSGVFTGGTPTLTSPNWSINFLIRRNGAVIANQLEIGTAASPMNLATTSDLYLQAGDVIEFLFIVKSGSFNYAQAATSADLPTSFDYAFDLNNTFDFNLVCTQAEVIDGDTVNINNYLPPLKVADILKGDIKKHNLYVGEPDETGVVKIEPLDDFYLGTDEAIVMSEKVDHSKEIVVQPAANIEGKEYMFKFAEDRDYYKQLYFDQYGNDYGDYTYNVPSTFKEGAKVYQLPYAQSIPVEIDGTEIIIPRIISYDEQSGETKPYKGKARVFYNAGVKTLSTDTWDLVNSDTLVASNQTTYPVASHIDSYTSPTFDMNFGVPEIVYYTATAYTTDNLFSRYHEAFLRELTGRDSKLVDMYLKLDQNDLEGEFLRNLWNIKGTIFRINKVMEYDGNSGAPVTTRCQLVRINRGKTPNTYTIGPAHLPKKAPTTTNQYPDTIKKSGEGNTIDPSAKNVNVIGDNNTIGSDTKNILVLGDDITVANGTENLFVFDGTFLNPDTQGTVFIDNTDSPYSASILDSTIIVDTSAGDVEIDLNFGANMFVGKEITIKKTDKANEVIIDAKAGLYTIDGKDEIIIKGKNTAEIIRSTTLTEWIRK